MKKKTRLLALLLAALMLLAVGCGGAGDKEPKPEEQKKEYAAATVENGVYTSDFAGLTATLDQTWQVLTQEEIAQIAGLTSTLVTDEDLKKALSSGETIYDLYAMTATGATVNITVGDLGLIYGNLLDMKTLAQSVLDQLVSAFTSMGFENMAAEIATIPFAGAQETAVVVSGQLQGVDMYEVLVCKKVGNYVYTITACTYGEDGTADILALFQSL